MSALALRIIACVSMLLDHIAYCFDNSALYLEPLRWIGRIAFPLYVFLIVNGFRHTSNRPRYALRLAIFAVISQVPFALMEQQKSMFGTLNVFVTLLLALLTVWATDEMRKHRVTKYLCFLPTLAVYAVFYFGLIRSDYGVKGALLAMTFYLIDLRRFPTTGKKIAALCLTAAGMIFSIYHETILHYPIAAGYYVIQHLRGKAYTIAPLAELTKRQMTWQMTQLFALFALVPIFFYNGKKGRLPASRGGAKAVQLGFYLFYPVHMLALYGLRLLLR